jgi:large subunit ribosomal protein L9
MKVILLENLRKIGSIGDVIDVKRGFARNYLIVNKKALHASSENIKEVEKIKIELGKKDQEKKKEAKIISEKINNKEYVIKKLSTENDELYGSVKPTEISKTITSIDNIEVKPELIQLMKEIKSIGSFKVKINLHPEIQAEVIIKVITEETIQ